MFIYTFDFLGSNNTKKTPATTTNDVYHIYGEFVYSLFRPKWVIARQYLHISKCTARSGTGMLMGSHLYNRPVYIKGNWVVYTAECTADSPGISGQLCSQLQTKMSTKVQYCNFNARALDVVAPSCGLQGSCSYNTAMFGHMWHCPSKNFCQHTK